MGSVGFPKLLPGSESPSELTFCVLEETEPSYFASWAELVPADRTSVQGPVTAFCSGTNMVPNPGIWGLVESLS